MRRSFWPLVYLCVAALASGCGRDASPLTPSGSSALSLADFATGASTTDATGVMQAGIPPAEHGGPVITATGNQTVVNGGTMAVTVQGTTAFSKIYAYIGAKALGLVSESQGGVPGYFEIALPTPQTSTTVLLAFPQNIPLNQFDVRFAVADPSGAVGPSVSITASVLLVGTGDVQVTLSWDVDSDVDLHVIDPSGEEIFYAHRNAASGGALDLDSNAGCSLDHVRNENITWPVGRAPVGRYTVRVDYWDACGAAKTNYTVRINAGGTPQIVTGNFTGPGDQGGLGAGRTVGTFERQSGTGRVVFDVVAGQPDTPPAIRGVKPRPESR